MRYTRRSLVACVAGLLLGRPLPAQSVSVGLEVTENTGGVMESAFRSALRSFGDVTVVTAAERPRLLLRVVVLCRPEGDRCQQATGYAVSVSLAEPLNRMDVVAAVTVAVGRLEPSTQLSASTRAVLTTALEQSTSGFERYVMAWAAIWGREVYRRGVDELLSQFDSRCLERIRLFRRQSEARMSGDSAAARVLLARWADREAGWLSC